jgi:mRNA interferase RelE/StbE
LTTYRLIFLPSAQKEFDKLDSSIRAQFVNKLRERLGHPHVPAARLHGLANCYKIKLRAAGYRLVYQVDDQIVTVIVVAVGRRDRNLVYKIAIGRV